MFKSTILLTDVKHQRKKYQISVYYNLPANMRLNESQSSMRLILSITSSRLSPDRL